MENLYLIVLVCINAYFLVAVITNVIYFRRSTSAARIRGGPFVSVVIPARDEERLISGCVDSLLAQDYADYEVIVVDDDSTDATAELVRARTATDARLRLVSGGPLPDGWLGKPYALSLGTAAARGEILVLADADTVHEPDSVSWVVTNLEDHDADLLSGYLRQKYTSFGEAIVVPTMFAMMLLTPLFLIPRTKSSHIVFSVGQFVAMRREALDAVGGFEPIKDTIIDDMAMAVRMKERGYRGVFLDAKDVVSCHLYSGFRNAFGGVARSVYSAVGASPVSVVAMWAVVLAVIVTPPAWLLASLVSGSTPPGALIIAVTLFALQWSVVAWDREAPFAAVVFYPAVFLNLLFILTASMIGTGFGPGLEWKGRLVRVPTPADDSCETQVAEK